MSISAVILAATSGNAVNPDLEPEEDQQSVLVRMLAGKPMISWVRDSLTEAGAGDQLYILSSRHKDVRHVVGEEAAFSLYEEENGSSIILQAANFIESRSGITIVMPANLPLLRKDILTAALANFREKGYDAMVLTAITDEINGWEHIIRDTRGVFLESRPETSYAFLQGKREINGRVYLFNTSRLLSAIGKMGVSQAKNGEVSALLEIMMQEGRAVGTMNVEKEVLLPIQTLLDGNVAGHILNNRIIRKHVEQGVEFIDGEQTFVETTVEIGRGTVIWPGTVLKGMTHIGRDVRVGANTVINNSEIGDRCDLQQCSIQNSIVGERCQIAPFVHLHNGAWLDRDVKVGSGSDVCNSIIGHGVTIDARALINDADIGDGARFGSGAVTVNEDGSGQSYRTVIGPLAMVGSNVSLVAPVEVEANSYIAAGSVITGDVPAFGLAIGRQRQTIVEDWVRRGSKKRQPI